MAPKIPNEGDRIVLGVAVSSGAAYFALIDSNLGFKSDDPLERMLPPERATESESLGMFSDSIEQELRRIKPDFIAVGFTRKYNQWTAKSAYKRFRVDAAIFVAAHRQGVPASHVRLEDAAKAIGAKVTEIETTATAKLGAPSKYKGQRALASALAYAAAKERFE